MDLFAFIFVLLILLAGALMAAAFNRHPGPEIRPPQEWEPESGRYEYLKDARRMERRRSRVWWKMDELHAEFLEKTAGGVAVEPPPAEAARPADAPAAHGEVVTQGDVREAFEEFLRKG